MSHEKIEWLWTEKNDGVTVFTLDPSHLGQWIRQNGAEYTGDFVPGCLQDNFVMYTRRGYAAVYEHFCNEWSSDFYIEFQPGVAQDVFRRWYEFENEYNAEYGKGEI